MPTSGIMVALTRLLTGRNGFMTNGSEALDARYMVPEGAIGSSSQASVMAAPDLTMWAPWYPSPMVVCGGGTWKFTFSELVGTDTAISGTLVTRSSSCT